MRFVFLNLAFFILGVCLAQKPHDSTRMNGIRILASHNSYKKQPHKKVLKFLKRFEDKLGAHNNPDYIDYGHLRFSDQFDKYGIRGLELDVNYDPKGGHYKRRRVNFFLPGQRQRLKGVALRNPGFKLLHIADVDFETNYLTLKDALQEVKAWSISHPGHIPIYINIEAKGSHPADESKALQRLGFTTCIPFDTLAYHLLEQEINEVFEKEEVYRPSDFRQTYSSLRSRIDSIGWPLLKDVSGKVIFILEGSNHQIYKSFSNASMFYFGTENDSNAIFLLRNNAVQQLDEIRRLSKFFMIRTRTDAGTIESRQNNYSVWNAAIDSEAQILSTDYYMPDQRWSTYKVGFKNGLYQTIKIP